VTLHRLAKWRFSCAVGCCPALYSDPDDPATMVCQGKKLSTAHAAELLEVAEDETGVTIPTETLFRGTAKYVSEHGDDELARKIEEFLTARRL